MSQPSKRTSMALAYLIVVSALFQAALAASWSDTFTSYNSNLWSQSSDIEHCSDGACFEARPDHLLYGASGLTTVMDQHPCNETKAGCCIGGKCASYAAGHLRSADSYTYGHWSVVARIAHAPAGGPTPSNAFTCFGAYVAAPAHNEISMCWEGTSQSTLGAAYWYSNAEHKTDIDLGFDASQDFHTYEVDWSPTTIVWSVDGKALHTDNGKAKSTIPWEAMEFAIITRPRSQPYEGDAESQFKLFNFTSTYSGPLAA